MHLKKLLASFIIFSVFITGCNNFEKKDTVSSRAKQQQTMTKVQNDVNEIMNKDYDYVLSNMGTPYSTTYWIDKEKMNEAKTIDDINKTGTIAMIYPKYTSDNELDGSALYIELYNNKVIEVQTYDFNIDIIEEETEEDDSVLVIDKYSETGELELKDIENINLELYKNKDLKELYNKLNGIKPTLDVYEMIGKTKSVEIYMLNKNEKDSKKVLIVFANNGKIEDIKITNSDLIIDQTKGYLLN